jgi:ribosomal protein S21
MGYHLEVKARPRETAEKLIKRFSRKVKEARIVEEYRERMYYIKPSAKRRQAAARRKKVLEKLRKETNKTLIRKG